jgi:carboxypeptidase Taq
MAEAVSLGVHESQSRLWENQVGRSRAFWEYYYPGFSEWFKEPLTTSKGSLLPLDDFLRALNKMEPSFIRVEADEVTYNLHIILRFEIERALIEGDLEVSDVQEAWNQKSKELLGLDPKTPSEGYMQDVHWSVGLMGYFPTYSLGNIFSAQLFQKAKTDIVDLETGFGKGNFKPLREWLRENVHRHGRMYMPKELIENAVGEKPSSKAFVEYLEGKYSALYEL